MPSPELAPSRSLSPEAQQATAKFGAYVRDMLGKKLAAGHSYSFLNDEGRVVHMHPDGRVRASRDPNSEAIG